MREEEGEGRGKRERKEKTKMRERGREKRCRRIPNVSHPIDDLKASDAIRDILRSHLIFGHIGSRALNVLMKAKVITSHWALIE